MNIQWIDRKEKELPFGNDTMGVLVSHPYGVEFITFHRRAWRYAYTGEEIGNDLFNKITHWCIPQKAITNPGVNHGD